MAKKISELIDILAQSPVTIEMNYKYKNSVELSGWILRKPKIIKHDKTGVESCSLIIYQITNANNEIKLDSFSCIVYVKDLVEQLKKQENVIFVATVGKLRYHKQRGTYSQIVEIKTLMELDLPLAQEWEAKTCND